MTRTVGVRAITFAAAVLAASPVFGQAKGGAAGTTGAGGTTGTGTTGTGTGTTGIGNTGGRIPSISNTPSTQQQPTVTIQQPIFISGRVALEDGSAPTEQVVIQTVCNGMPHSEGYADGKGYFAIELGANRGVIQDASEFSNGSSLGSPMGRTTTSGNSPFGAGSGGAMGMNQERRYMGCDLQAKLSGYRSQSVSLSGRRPMDDPNVGTILLHRLGAQEEGRTVSAVSLAAPKDAKKAYQKALDDIKKHKLEDAQNNLEKAVESYPQFAEAWYELGRLRLSQSQFDIARGSFNQAIAADPKFVPPYLSLSVVELQARRWQEVADVTDKMVKLDPFDYPQAYFFNSVANFNLHNLPASEKSGLEAEKLDTRNQYPQVHHLLGMILADRKDWDGAAKHFKEYLRIAPQGSDAETVRNQLAQVEKIQQQLATAKNQ